jgi:hypothetical protein
LPVIVLLLVVSNPFLKIRLDYCHGNSKSWKLV